MSTHAIIDGLIDAGMKSLKLVRDMNGSVSAASVDWAAEHGKQLEEVSLNMLPIRAHQIIFNWMTLGHYLNDEFSVSGAFGASIQRRAEASERGDWLTRFVHFIVFSSIFQRLSCGLVPRYRRLHNSYVHWDGVKRQLFGSAGRGCEFDHMRATTRPVSVILAAISLFMILSARQLGTTAPRGYGHDLALLPQHLVWLIEAVFVEGMLGSVCFVILLWLQRRNLLLIGSREGVLPSLLLHLFQAHASQHMLSYSWGAPGHVALARGLAAVLPDCWIDVKNLVSGQQIRVETMRCAQHARVLVILLSYQYTTSLSCANELYAAVLHRRMVGDSACHKTIVLMDKQLLAERNTETQHATIDWVKVEDLLRKAGCDIVRSVDELIVALDERGVRARTEQDRQQTLSWWLRYGASAASPDQKHSRVAWNLLDYSKRRARRVQVGFISRFWYACCRRRPAASVSTGVEGAWLPYDASLPPQPHIDVTPKQAIGILLSGGALIGAVFCIIVLAAVGLERFFEAVGVAFMMGLAIQSFILVLQWRHANELSALAFMLHSRVLFSLLALTEVQDQGLVVDERRVPAMSRQSSLMNLLGNAMSNSWQASPPPSPPPSPATQLKRQATGTSKLQTSLQIVFAADEAARSIGCVRNLNEFVCRYVLGLDPVPQVQPICELLETTYQPRPMTIYVFFLDTVASRKAFLSTLQRSAGSSAWLPEHMVLIADTHAFDDPEAFAHSGSGTAHVSNPLASPGGDQHGSCNTFSVKVRDFMLITYEWRHGALAMLPASPFTGIVPAVLEAISTKIPLLLMPRAHANEYR